jgi:hypothetical protein
LTAGFVPSSMQAPLDLTSLLPFSSISIAAPSYLSHLRTAVSFSIVSSMPLPCDALYATGDTWGSAWNHLLPRSNHYLSTHIHSHLHTHTSTHARFPHSSPTCHHSHTPYTYMLPQNPQVSLVRSSPRASQIPRG